MDRPLTLISAPPGSGKTVLLRAWIASQADPEATAYVALDHQHADPRTFWLDVLAEAARARPSLTGLAVPTGGEESLAALRGALAELTEPLRLVLDDFHEVGAGQATKQLGRLVEQVPDGLRLVLATRRDPPMRLQRLGSPAG